MMNYNELYNYTYNELFNIVCSFIDSSVINKQVLDSLLNNIFDLENYLNILINDHDIVHLAVNSSLYEICKEKSCSAIWDFYSRNYFLSRDN